MATPEPILITITSGEPVVPTPTVYKQTVVSSVVLEDPILSVDVFTSSKFVFEEVEVI